MSDSSFNTVERAGIHTIIWMSTGAAAAIPALLVPQPDDPLLTVTVHLSLLVLFAIGLTFHLAALPVAEEGWFAGSSLSEVARRGLGGVFLVVMVTGATGLVTLATSAALRYDPSLQFLQLLSALDIAWAAAALTLGLRRWKGAAVAVEGALILGAVCVWAIWRYLDIVGFDAAGGWIVDAGELMTLVLPYDMAAGAVAVIVFALAMRRPQRTAQPSDQS